MKIEVSPQVANMLVSWKTSLIGLLGFIALDGPQLIAWLQDHKELNGSMLVFGFIVFALGLFARDGDKSSEHTGAKQPFDDTPVSLPVADKIPPIPFVIFAVLCLGMLAGCTSTVSVQKANQDSSNATNATANQDVPFIAKFIADTWADHETKTANRLFDAALAENSVLATVTPAVPSPGTPATASTVKVVPEPQRGALQAKHAQDLDQIAIGRQQIEQAVINRFKGNLDAAQALQKGQANYYKTAGANASTLQAGLDGALAAFQQFAPVISQVAAKKK